MGIGISSDGRYPLYSQFDDLGNNLMTVQNFR